MAKELYSRHMLAHLWVSPRHMRNRGTPKFRPIFFLENNNENRFFRLFKQFQETFASKVFPQNAVLSLKKLIENGHF